MSSHETKAERAAARREAKRIRAALAGVKEPVGEFTVARGQVVAGDPCYADDGQDPGDSWARFPARDGTWEVAQYHEPDGTPTALRARVRRAPSAPAWEGCGPVTVDSGTVALFSGASPRPECGRSTATGDGFFDVCCRFDARGRAVDIAINLQREWAEG